MAINQWRCQFNGALIGLALQNNWRLIDLPVAAEEISSVNIHDGTRKISHLLKFVICTQNLVNTHGIGYVFNPAIRGKDAL